MLNHHRVERLEASVAALRAQLAEAAAFDANLERLRAKWRFVEVSSVEWEEHDQIAQSWVVRLSHVGASGDDVFVDGALGESASAVVARAVAELGC